LIDEAIPLPLKFDRIQLDKRTASMEEIISINEEIHG
jgi:hypothetical protein